MALDEKEKLETKEISNNNSDINKEDIDVDLIVEEVKEKIVKDIEEEAKKEPDTSYKPVKQSDNSGKQVLKIFENLVFAFIAVIALAFTIFTIAHLDNSTIASGVSIVGIDVSNLDRNSAVNKISNSITKSLENNIILKYNEFETNISPEQLEASFDVDSAVNAAFEVSTGNNIFSNSFKKIVLLVNPVDIKPSLSVNDATLETALNNISTQLPDAVIQSDYYIEDNNLVITSGKTGTVVDIPTMKNIITTKLNDLSFVSSPISIATKSQNPEALDIEKIYSEIRKDATNAHFTTNPYVVYPEENGLDFNISLDEAKEMLKTSQEEYIIPLKVLYPNITTNMIGMEAFPDLLSSFTTKYATSNRDRTTNLKLAAGKINGTVLLPGETFSYNEVVGKRTIAAGYKEAAIYQDGQVVNGLGGGICQISTTLYNAALYANLEITERRNHQFVPSYVNAGRDATVVYGSQDFKFKNNRNYAIKLVCYVDKGVAKFDIYGLREADDYEVVISSNITKRTSKSITSATYKTLKQNGQVVSTETISRDTYKVH